MVVSLNIAKGYILIVVMLFLLVFSLLALGVMKVGLLENKMNLAHQSKITSFYKAEDALLALEQKVLGDNGIVDERVEIIVTDVCGVDFYRLTVCAEHGKAKTVLQSSFSKMIDYSECNERPNIKPGRQSFLIIR